VIHFHHQAIFKVLPSFISLSLSSAQDKICYRHNWWMESLLLLELFHKCCSQFFTYRLSTVSQLKLTWKCKVLTWFFQIFQISNNHHVCSAQLFLNWEELRFKLDFVIAMLVTCSIIKWLCRIKTAHISKEYVSFADRIHQIIESNIKW